jgi:hypothetical protein
LRRRRSNQQHRGGQKSQHRQDAWSAAQSHHDISSPSPEPTCVLIR